MEEIKEHLLANFRESILPTKLIGLDKQYTTLYNIIERTITHGESNSALLIGPRASGKSVV
jgi:origin recognition complex subunit 4